jgi:hypothetical protein
MDFTVRVGQEEVGRILNLRENLDHRELLVDYASRYRKLGWVLAAVTGPGEATDLDFSQPQATWAGMLTDLGGAKAQINLGIRTGQASRLLVLEVNQGGGALALETFGDWRAECIAALGESREQHYYTLPPEGPWPTSLFRAPQVLFYGEGGLVLAPPSLEGESRASWRWLKAPWEHPPRSPGTGVWQFLREYLPEANVPAILAEPQVPSWEEIYHLISPWDSVLKALLAPAPTPQEYYHGLLQAALAVGLAERPVLLGLLWYAPQGDARTKPERWKYLKEMVANVSDGLRTPALPRGLSISDPAFPGFVELKPLGGDPAGTRFDQSLAGQFFQLLAGLGEQVITHSCRNEAQRLGSGGSPGARAGLWDRHFSPNAPGSDHLVGQEGKDPLGLWEEKHQIQARYYQEVQEATQEFQKNHPDLAGDKNKVQMVLLCLKNYVNLDPEFAELSVKVRLERAAAMARGFLQEMD